VLPQAAVGPDDMIVGAPPLNLVLQASGGLCRGPGAAGERGDALAHGQVEAFHEGGLQPPTPAQQLQRRLESTPRATAHLVADADKAALPVAFVQLAIKKSGINLPVSAPPRGDPGPKVRRERIEVEAQPIRRDDWRAAGGQGAPQAVDEGVGCPLGASPERQGRDEFGFGIKGQPEPEDSLARAQAGADLVQLHVRQVKIVQDVVMEACRLLGGTVPPAGDRRLPMAKDAHRGTDTEPFGQGAEHLPDACRGCLELKQGGAPACAHAVATSLTGEILDVVGAPVMAIGDQCMDLAVGDAGIEAPRRLAGVALCGDAPGGATAACALPSRTHARCLQGARGEGPCLPTVGALVGRAWPPVPTRTGHTAQSAVPYAPPPPTCINEKEEAQPRSGPAATPVGTSFVSSLHSPPRDQATGSRARRSPNYPQCLGGPPASVDTRANRPAAAS